MAMDQRVDTLDANRVLEVYGVVAVDEPRFELSFPTPTGEVWLCAVGPASLGGVEYFSHMGCTLRPLQSRELQDGSPPLSRSSYAEGTLTWVSSVLVSSTPGCEMAGAFVGRFEGRLRVMGSRRATSSPPLPRMCWLVPT